MWKVTLAGSALMANAAPAHMDAVDILNLVLDPTDMDYTSDDTISKASDLYALVDVASADTSCTLTGLNVRSPYDCQLLSVHIAANPPSVGGSTITLDTQEPFAVHPPDMNSKFLYPSGCNIGTFTDKGTSVKRVFWNAQSEEFTTNTAVTEGSTMPICYKSAPAAKDYLPEGCPSSSAGCTTESLKYWCPATCSGD